MDARIKIDETDDYTTQITVPLRGLHEDWVPLRDYLATRPAIPRVAADCIDSFPAGTLRDEGLTVQWLTLWHEQESDPDIIAHLFIIITDIGP